MTFVESIGPLEPLELTLAAGSTWSADTRALSLQKELALTAGATLPGYQHVSCTGSYLFDRLDLREVYGYGVPFERPRSLYGDCVLTTNESLVFSVEASAYAALEQGRRNFVPFGGSLAAILRPHPRFELQLIGVLDTPEHAPFFIDALGNDEYLFADLTARTRSLTLRQLWVLAPNLTFQLYAQLFSAFGRSGPFYRGSSTGGAPIRLGELVETTPEVDPSFHASALRVSGVLRWEYQVGSTLFVVYSRSQERLPVEEGTAPQASLAPGPLSPGPATDGLMLNWSHAFDL